MNRHGTFITNAIAGTLLSALAAAAWSQPAVPYPAKLVRVINPVAAGGNQDVVARVYAEQFSRHLGQQFVVESRPGNSAIVGTRLVKSAAPDGYTLLAISNTFARTPAIIKDVATIRSRISPRFPSPATRRWCSWSTRRCRCAR